MISYKIQIERAAAEYKTHIKNATALVQHSIKSIPQQVLATQNANREVFFSQLERVAQILHIDLPVVFTCYHQEDDFGFDSFGIPTSSIARRGKLDRVELLEHWLSTALWQHLNGVIPEDYARKIVRFEINVKDRNISYSLIAYKMEQEECEAYVAAVIHIPLANANETAVCCVDLFGYACLDTTLKPKWRAQIEKCIRYKFPTASVVPITCWNWPEYRSIVPTVSLRCRTPRTYPGDLLELMYSCNKENMYSAKYCESEITLTSW